MPAFEYSVDTNWSGTSSDPSNKSVINKNHDSSVDEAEVIRLAKRGVALLIQQTEKTVSDAKDSKLSEIYKSFKAPEGTVYVVVKKGVHQRFTKPHITVRLPGDATLHFWLTQRASKVETLTDKMVYNVCSVSATEQGGMVPPVALVKLKRGNSISMSVETNKRREVEAKKKAAALAQIDKVVSALG